MASRFNPSARGTEDRAQSPALCIRALSGKARRSVVRAVPDSDSKERPEHELVAGRDLVLTMAGAHF